MNTRGDFLAQATTSTGRTRRSRRHEKVARVSQASINKIATNLQSSLGYFPLVSGANFRGCERSWLEQRRFIELSVSALQNHSVVDDIQDELKKLKPSRPNLKSNALEHSVVCLISPFYSVGFSQRLSKICRLRYDVISDIDASM